MKAVIYKQYGGPEVLSVQELPIPVPNEKEILVKVFATTVNRTDCAIISGSPYIMRLFMGLLKPRTPIPGTDFAGEVMEVGAKVSDFKVGDRVFGFDDLGLASMSQFIRLRADKPISIIPQNLDYAQAVASLEAAHYALNFMNKVPIQAGQKILVNGATGAIGSALVQLLKAKGVYVTATCYTAAIPVVESLGPDRIIDYTQVDFTQDKEVYDFVFDAVGKSTFAKCKPLLTKKGIYISSELGPNGQNPFLALITPLMGGKRVVFPFPSNIKGSIRYMKDVIEKGKFKALIDRRYSMEQVGEAYSYVRSGKKMGNVIVEFH